MARNAFAAAATVAVFAPPGLSPFVFRFTAVNVCMFPIPPPGPPEPPGPPRPPGPPWPAELAAADGLAVSSPLPHAPTARAVTSTPDVTANRRIMYSLLPWNRSEW
ncbi:hypothetical protein Apa02nite_081500 [Actinoplanes palleronii]|uniref:Secreted protein n=1 Tax=Actinoplanes palleronii TaxID=113570 RepID=A0ABQ4BN54_9ACTN|nr:hypothetical protein Apa02nite_081500 [Actinoplanes palleronii]